MSDASVSASIAAAAPVAQRDVYVLPGEVRVAAVPTRFFTVLGSCVSVCLYDRAHRVGGLNHFLLPGSPPPTENDLTRWSEFAMKVLFEKVLAAGARQECLEAKVFGGARISARDVPDAMRIGDRNIDEAIVALRRRGVDIVNRSTGGNLGRKLIFESHSGVVWVKELTRQGLPEKIPSEPTRKSSP